MYSLPSDTDSEANPLVGEKERQCPRRLQRTLIAVTAILATAGALLVLIPGTSRASLLVANSRSAIGLANVGGFEVPIPDQVNEQLNKIHIDQDDLKDKFSRATSNLIAGGSALLENVKSVASDLMPNESASDPCTGTPWLNMQELKRNNLGNKGPDQGEEGLYFEGPFENSATDANVRVQLKFNDQGLFPYTPDSNKHNGFSGKYMSFNMRQATTIAVKISIVNAETKQPMKLNRVFFTWFDIDHGEKNGEACAREFVEASGFAQYYLTQHTEIYREPTARGTRFWSTTVGTGADNPLDPSNLTQQQRNRAISFEFHDFTEASFIVGNAVDRGYNPRYFSFTGRPSLLCANSQDGNAGDNIVLGLIPEKCCMIKAMNLFCVDKPSWWTFWQLWC